MDLLTENVRDGSLMEFSHVDNLALCEESSDELIRKYERWKKVLERKSLEITVEKTKGMQLLYGKKAYFSNIDPRGEQVDYNAIWSTKCQK